VSQELRREPKLQLLTKPLFAESTWCGSRGRTGPQCKSPFAESILLSALGEGLSWWRHPHNRNGHFCSLNSPRARCTWLSAKKYACAGNTFAESITSSVSILTLLTANFPKKTSHFRAQTFSLIHIHSYNVHVQNWRHFVFVCYI
jgi:hypothetical protein